MDNLQTSFSTALPAVLAVTAACITSFSYAEEIDYEHLSGEFYRAPAMTSGNLKINFINNGGLNEELANNVVSSQDMITTVVTSLGLSVSDLEKVLKVKRATLYNWRKGGDVKAEDSQNRLKDVYEVAKVISEFNDKPFGRRAKTLLINGQSYFDLLEHSDLNIELIVEHAKLLKSQASSRMEASKRFRSQLNDINNISGEITIYES